MNQPTLFDLSATDLLERFGAGNATPGSGCAAALMALLSAKLVTAVARMTVERAKTADVRAQAQLIVNVLEGRIGPRLRELFDEDALEFDAVIAARRRRDQCEEKNERRKYAQEASDRLRRSTDILFEIIDLAFQCMAYGQSIWQIGFQPAMGDAGAGTVALEAAAP